MNNEELERLATIAARCQLIIGSFKGSSRACPCLNASECKLTLEQRAMLTDHPLVKQSAYANRMEYYSRKGNYPNSNDPPIETRD